MMVLSLVVPPWNIRFVRAMVVLHMVREYSSNTAGPALCCSVLARFFRTKIFFVTTRRIYTFTGSLMRAAGRVTNASTSTDSPGCSRRDRTVGGVARGDGGRIAWGASRPSSSVAWLGSGRMRAFTKNDLSIPICTPERNKWAPTFIALSTTQRTH